jgi:hypothetical protein
MPNEHHVRPADRGEWRKYHEASTGELHRGELFDHWLREHPELGHEAARAKFEEMSGRRGDTGEIKAFESWRTAELAEIASAEKVADVAISESVTIVIAEWKRQRFPDFRDPKEPEYEDRQLKDTYGELRTAGDDELARELKAFGADPKDAGMMAVGLDARSQVVRSGGALHAVANAFGAACAKAVADYHGEKPGGPAWENSSVKTACEALSKNLEGWEKLLQTRATPDRAQLHNLAGVVSSHLRSLARECVVPGSKAGEVAFVRITGLAIVHALGEKIAAQLASRVGVPTFQGMHDRLADNAVRADVNGEIATAYRKGSDTLSKVWKKQLEGFKGRLNKIDKKITANFEANLGGENGEKALKDYLDKWNTNFKKPGKAGTGAALQASVGSVAFELARIREIVSRNLTPKEDAHASVADIREARLFMLDSIDGLVRQIQSDIAVGVTVNNDLG